MSTLNNEIRAYCSDESRTAYDICTKFDVTRWYVYQMARRGELENVGTGTATTRYVATAAPAPAPSLGRKKAPQWEAPAEAIQAASVFAYAQRCIP